MPKSKIEICLVAGARPNFMKIAPILEAMSNHKRFRPFLIHTGQHYDAKMSREHFVDLELPAPDANLDVGSGTHGEQTARVLERIEPILSKRRPRLVIVVGDVNSTLAATLAAKKLHIDVAHVEAGLRSRDWTMPEEINRVGTDAISDYLFTHCREADRNLLREGVPKSRIFFVGNVMIDTLDRMLKKASKLPVTISPQYVLVTLHRPSNVDDIRRLRGIVRALENVAKGIPVLFPIHPRTAARLKRFKVRLREPNLRIVPPYSYLPFLALMSRATLVVTDSGGIQEETTAMNIPCLTLRKTSERMVTVHEGTNRIVGEDPSAIPEAVRRAIRRPKRISRRPALWDGHAAERIVRVLERKFIGHRS